MTSSRQTQSPKLSYIFSIPERTMRAIAVLVGGFVHETAEVLLPDWMRRSRLYQSTIGGLVRIVIEFVGGLSGVLPADNMDTQEFAKRKAVGTGVELAGILAMGLSPIWLFAATADITGGTRTYLGALVAELQREGILPEDTDIASVEQLLNTLEGTSGQMVEMVDVPPLNVVDLRTSFGELKRNATDLPDTSRLASLFDDLRLVARREEQSLQSVSSLMALGAARAGVQVGQTHVFDYYQVALHTINKEGLPVYAKRVTRPYMAVAKSHFNPQRLTHTERLLQRRHQRKEVTDKNNSVEKGI